MAEFPSRVFVVDDDASVRDALSNLLEAVGLHAEVFASTEGFLNRERSDVPSCLVLDVRLPGMNGLDFQQQLIKRGVTIPIIFITAHGDIPMTTRAMKAGAVEFLPKPFQKEDLIAAIHHAIERDRKQREVQSEVSELQSRYEKLTAREREVMDQVVAGTLNKQIAAKLELSLITVKIHRRQVMQKMKAASLADLVRMSDRLKARR